MFYDKHIMIDDYDKHTQDLYSFPHRNFELYLKL